MISDLRNNWIIIIVIIPGMVFYASFMGIVAVLNIENPFFAVLNNDPILASTIIVACGIILQIFGMITEYMAFGVWHYKDFKKISMKDVLKPSKSEKNCAAKHEKYLIHYAWWNRYPIISKYVNENTSIERIIAQFFMSHNISVGFNIHLIWVIGYLVVINEFNSGVYQSLAVILFIIAGSSIIASILRFRNCTRSLYTMVKNKTEFISDCNATKYPSMNFLPRRTAV